MGVPMQAISSIATSSAAINLRNACLERSPTPRFSGVSGSGESTALEVCGKAAARISVSSIAAMRDFIFAGLFRSSIVCNRRENEERFWLLRARCRPASSVALVLAMWRCLLWQGRAGWTLSSPLSSCFGLSATQCARQAGGLHAEICMPLLFKFDRADFAPRSRNRSSRRDEAGGSRARAILLVEPGTVGLPLERPPPHVSQRASGL